MKSTIVTFLACFLMACGQSQTNSDPIVEQKPTTVSVITWSKLMPDGGYDALDREQKEFYEGLSTKLMAGSRRLYDLPKTDNVNGIEEGSSLDYMPQLGTFETVPDFEGQRVKIPGYVVPLNFEGNGRFREFLFVPSQGACIHAPPPPPNQVIYVKMPESITIENTDLPYWLEGKLHSERNEHMIGDAAYTITSAKLTPYPILK